MPDVLQDVSQFPPRARLTPKVHRVLGMNRSSFTGPGTNTYLVGMDGPEPLLIDTGIGLPVWAELLQAQLSETQAPPLVRCLMTHGHPDHVGGVADLQRLFPALPFHKHPWPERDAAVPAPMAPIADGDVIRGPGYTLRAIYTPGHAPDHICFYLEEERALFTGDVILGVGTTVIPREGGDLGLYLDTLRRLQTLDLARIYPGHGPVIEDPQAKIAYYLEHRLERERQILAELAAGPRDVMTVVRSIYRDYPENLHAAAAQSVTSHLDKLEREGRVGRDDADPPHYALMA
ncbi:MAG TPA: MBL fold metallo-hydrolase [bacterium]|nr:MBL fold metallo-hydrolase [bacterium]